MNKAGLVVEIDVSVDLVASSYRGVRPHVHKIGQPKSICCGVTFSAPCIDFSMRRSLVIRLSLLSSRFSLLLPFVPFV